VPQSKRHPARRPEKRPAKPSHSPRTQNPSRRPAPTSDASPARRRLEIASAGPLLVLSRLPKWVVPAVLALLLVGGLAINSPWSALFLVPVALFLAWLLALAWPVLSTRGRLMRLLVVLLVVAAAIARFVSLI
jgi:hypothetical protein